MKLLHNFYCPVYILSYPYHNINDGHIIDKKNVFNGHIGYFGIFFQEQYGQKVCYIKFIVVMAHTIFMPL